MSVDRYCARLLRVFDHHGGSYHCEHTGQVCRIVGECDERKKSRFIAANKKEGGE